MSRPGVTLARQVRKRAGERCEYCRFPAQHAMLPFEVEHVIPIKHKGETILENLALACFYCNRYKGPNVAGISAPQGPVTRLFNPRVDRWEDHFAWDAAMIVPRTEVARVTVSVLRMNQPNAVAVRQLLMSEGLW